MTDFAGALRDINAGLAGAPENPPSVPLPKGLAGQALDDIAGTSPQAETPKSPPAPHPAGSFAAGIDTALIAGTLGLPVDVVTSVLNMVPGVKIQQPVGGSEWINRQMSRAGVGTQALPATTQAEKYAEAAGLGVGSMIGPNILGKARVLSAVAGPAAQAAEDVLGAGSAPSAAAIGAVSGGGGEAGREIAPKGYEQAGELAGQLMSGLPATSALALGSGIKRAIPPIGRATREAVAQEAATQRLGSVSTDPDAAAAQIRQEIAAGRQELVPGSVATTGELANDPGILAAQRVRERESTLLGEQVREQRAAANDARWGALEGMAPTSVGPEATTSYLRQLLLTSDQLAQRDIANARSQAEAARLATMPSMAPEEQGAAARQAIEEVRQPMLDSLSEAHEEAQTNLRSALNDFGGSEALGTPEERAAAPGTYGESMREPIQAAYDTERKRLSDLREAIDPSGKMGMSSSAITDSVAQIRSMFHPDTFGGMENKFYDRVEGWGSLVPIEDAFRLRADVNSRLRAVTDHNPQEQLRLLTLREGIDKSLDDAANGIHQMQGAAPETVSPPIVERLAGVGPGFLSDVARAYQTNPNVLRSAARDPLTRAILDRGTQVLPEAAPNTRPVGDLGAQQGRPQDSPGVTELSTGAGQRASASEALAVSSPGVGIRASEAAGSEALAPLTDEARQRFADWNRQYGEMARLYRGETPGQLHAVGKILQKGGAYDSFKLRDDQIPWLFVDGKDAAVATGRFLAAAPPEAHAALDDAFAFSLRRAAQNPDGTLNLKNYSKWLDGHRDALAQRPDLLDKFSTAAKAQRQLEEVNNSIEQFYADHPLKPGLSDSGVLPQVWKAGPKGGDAMRRYLEATGRKPESLAAIADYAAYDFANRPGIIRNGSVVPTAAEAWIKQHQSALNAVPGLKERFADAAAAQRTLEETAAAHQDLRDLFTKSIAGAFIQDDPARAIDRVFAGTDRLQNAKILMAATVGSPVAQEGLRRATIDYIRRRFEGAPMPGGEVGTLTSKRFGDFVDNNRDVLNVLFPGRAKLFDAVAEDAKRGTLVAQAKMPGGSDTAELRAHMAHPEESRTGPLVAAYAAERLAEHGSEIFSHIPLIRWLAGPATYIGARQIQAAGVRLRLRADQLFDQMLLDPRVGATALDAYRKLQIAKTATPIRDRFWGRAAGQLILASHGGGLATP